MGCRRCGRVSRSAHADAGGPPSARRGATRGRCGGRETQGRSRFGARPISCYPSRRTTAGCPSGQWKRTVNPSRKLRRFESFTCHHQRKQPLTSGNADRGLFRGVRRRPAETDHLRLSVAYSWPRRPECGIDATLGETLLVVEGVGVNPQQHRHAVPGPSGHLSGWDTSRQPGGQAGMAQAVGAPRRRKGVLLGCQGRGSRHPQHSRCLRGRDRTDERPSDRTSPSTCPGDK